MRNNPVTDSDQALTPRNDIVFRLRGRIGDSERPVRSVVASGGRLFPTCAVPPLTVLRFRSNRRRDEFLLSNRILLLGASSAFSTMFLFAWLLVQLLLSGG